ncbi:phage replisome organizer N-terminal domain-containing protein [Clostridium paridis]|uniref:Phage replisome organizer N-terminal domain-containing protein n=1 Tax=Clostridium paridis TaxID=2803863 RepID=A0A937K458_9CLOT|nr:phage replisome organizer N-terminal domain-containing protein [Clostridium paridis]MBL4933026.1 phage replisome organizer N-terminal domain-containing protein [Clostridium paridis]
MADNKRYYYLKLKDNFFDTEEIRILESLPNGIFYSNLLIKLYLKSLKFDGALKFNDFIPYDEQMISTITNLNIDIVKSGLNILNSMKLIERLDDGTIYLMNIQSFIGKSSSEADRKRLYREKIEEEKLLIVQGKSSTDGQMSQACPDDVPKTNGTIFGKHPPEKEREDKVKELELEYKDKEKEKEKKVNSKSMNLDELSLNLLSYFQNIAGNIGEVSLSALKVAIANHGFDYVKMAIDTALEKNKLTITYINGILRNWLKEGYPMKGDTTFNGGTREDIETDQGEKYQYKQHEGRRLSEEERREISQEIL